MKRKTQRNVNEMKANLLHVHNQVPVKHSFPIEITQESKVSFKDVLAKEQLTISNHAKTRMEERNISIDSSKWKQISDKLQEANEKGVTNSLVFMNDAALLVSVKNNTVITALNRSEMESKLFTNINGAIVLE